MLHFDSDYMKGAHPEVMRRLLETNMEQTTGYGTDAYCNEAERLILEACGLEHGKVYFLTGGTQTNATVIDGLLHKTEGVIATDTAHINVHEAGAIEASGHKVMVIPGRPGGKLAANDVEHYLEEFYNDESHKHMPAPGMVYITFPTELGALYSLAELEALSTVCRKFNIPLYLDGARLGYGLTAEGNDVTLKDIARLCDAFYIGGTKCGALFGEAVVTRRPELLPHFFTFIKQHGALLAKGRLLGVQFATLFTDNLYLTAGRNAVNMAMKLKKAFTDKGYKLYVNSPTNQQFFILPNEIIERLRKNVTFELWGTPGEKETAVRFVTDWGTQECEIEELKKLL